MATIYLRSVDGDDGDDGSSKALAKATLQAAMTAAGAGGRVIAANDHSESYSAHTTLVPPASIAADAPVEVLSINWSTDALETGAAIGVTGAYALNLSAGGTINFMRVLFRGWTFSSDAGFVALISLSNHQCTVLLDHCTLTTANGVIAFGPTGRNRCGFLWLRNCTINLNGTGQVSLRLVQVYCDRLTLGTCSPTIPFVTTDGLSGPAVFNNSDFSAAGSGKTLFDVSGTVGRDIRCYRCRAHPDAIIVNTPLSDGVTFNWIESDASTNYVRQLQATLEGNITEDVVRIRDDSDSTYSFKMASTAAASFVLPLRSFPVARYNATEGSAITVRVDVLTDNVTLTDGDFWIEVNYLGSASYPLGSLASSAKADILASASNLSTSSEGWTTTDLSTPVKQYATVTFTPQKTGAIEITACLAKASTTVYVDPDATVS
jgi:hypothetical protein